MKVQALVPNFQLPTKSTDNSGGFDIYMPTRGTAYADAPTKAPLGFAAAIPPGYVGLLLPRSGVGAREGLALNNTCGVIDADYRGEWCAYLRVQPPVYSYTWGPGERLLQVLFVPVASFNLELVDNLPGSERGTGGFGSSGK